MRLDERFAALRLHARHRYYECGCDEVEQHLDAIQAEIAELLARIPDRVPASITVTAH